ncbi:malonyl CoA-acyl carrier protein transacylase [Spirochaetia bacterium]|nr:malonyl CoA-acyl carrier protein transacylase [Spirochaetia bacterium]
MTEKKYAFLFPGQGAQYTGMGLDFAKESYAKQIFELASDIMGQDMEDLLANSDAESLKQTKIAQPAITVVNLTAAAALQARGIMPCACAGHSLGEYAALCTAGVFGLQDCLMLVKERGAFMQATGEAIKPHGDDGIVMAAVIGLDPAKVEEVVENAHKTGINNVFTANYNSSKQTVLSGLPADMAKIESFFKDAGARRFMPLKVAGPFHSPLMAEAENKFAAVLEKVVFNNSTVPVFSNVSGKAVKDATETKSLLLRQITSGVHWIDEEAGIAALGVDAVCEVGPGKVLCGLWEQAGSGVPSFAAGTLADVLKI